MDCEEYHRRLYEVKYIARMNSRFHQYLASRYEWQDKAIRIVVALFAIAGLIFAVPKFETLCPESVGICVPWTGFVVAIISIFVAGALNIVPIVEKAKLHGELFRAWSELSQDAAVQEHRTCDTDKVPAHIADRLEELVVKMESLHAEEPFADEKLLLKFQGDENERTWGNGIRTYEQVEAERIRRDHRSDSSSGASVVSAVDQE
jgi:hypothetical protein